MPSEQKTILIIGTYDTKDSELSFMADCIQAEGGKVIRMDAGVLGEPVSVVDISKEEVAAQGGSTIPEIISLDDENQAMQAMAKGATKLALDLYTENQMHGVIILGGTMGTDLALEVCQALPIGIPKQVVSTVSFSPMIAPSRLAADIQMTLWAGGLYGLNSICKSSLSLAAGAVLGAARSAKPWNRSKPVVGMTSFGSTVLTYMIKLLPEIEKRGFELAVFHATGMGGMAFDNLARKGVFSCVMDFAPQEITNLVYGSVLSAGESRMLGAGLSNTPQIVAPGCIDLIDFPTWQDPPAVFKGREFHAHNRLICSAGLTQEERCRIGREICDRISQSRAPVNLIVPKVGIQGWDKEGQPFYDPEAQMALVKEFRNSCKPSVILTELDCHINDQEFADKALKIFDQWLDEGIITS